jgi:hypothetical protein
MARDLKNQPNVDTPTADYPFSRIRDKTGTVSGTKVNESTNGDLQQLMMKMMNAAGVTPNDKEDNVTNGYQLFDALTRTVTVPILQLFGSFTTDLPDFGSGNLGATLSGIHVIDRKAYIVDTTNTEIRVFSVYGEYLANENFGGGNLTSPTILQLVGDKAYVLDNGGAQFQTFTVSTGAHIPAESFVLFAQSTTIFIDAANDRLYALSGASNIDAHVLSTGAHIPAESFAVGGALEIVSDLFIADGIAYVVNTTNNNIEPWDIVTKTIGPTFGSGASLSTPQRIFIIGDKKYISDSAGIIVFDDKNILISSESFLITLPSSLSQMFISDGVFYYPKIGPVEIGSRQQTFDAAHK